MYSGRLTITLYIGEGNLCSRHVKNSDENDEEDNDNEEGGGVSAHDDPGSIMMLEYVMPQIKFEFIKIFQLLLHFILFNC